MSKKVTELTELTAIATNDLFIVEDVSASTTKKITWDNLVDDASITTAKLVDASVTPPKWTNPYKFSVYRNAAWTSSSGFFGKVQFDTKEFDTSSNYSTSTFRFTAPIAGFYFFSSSVMAAVGAGGGVGASLYKNGAEAKRGIHIVTGGASFNTDVEVSALLQLAATDYVEVFFYGSGGAGQTGPVVTYFQGYLVSAT